MADQPDPEITYTATGQGYYLVFVDSVEVSKHLQEREAVEAASAWKQGWPNSEVHYTHDYTVEVEMPGLIMDEDAPGPFEPPSQVPSPPAQPDSADMDITIVSSTSTEVTFEFSWPNVPDEDGYRWKAGGDSGEWNEPESGYNEVGEGVTFVQFTEERRTNDIESFACVHSFNEDGDSPDGCIGFTLPAVEATSPPDAPTGLSATAVSTSQVDLDWTASAGAEQYKVHRSQTQGFTVSDSNHIDTVSSTDYSDTTVVGDTTYFYRVVASNSAGDSDPSDEAGVTTGGFESPDEGTLLTGATPSSFTVPSGWTVHATDDFEGALTGRSRGFPGGTVVSTRSHTGSNSISAEISGDGNEMKMQYGPVDSREVYISWWEYLSPETRFNDETFFARVVKHGDDGGFLEVILDFFGTGGTGWNSPDAHVLFNKQTFRMPTGSYPAWTNHQKMVRPVGRWVQYEWHFKANTPGGVEDGYAAFYRDGEKMVEATNVNWTGDTDMSGMEVEVSYLYTRHNWFDDYPGNPDYNTENEVCSAGIGSGRAVAESDGTQTHRQSDFEGGGVCDPPEDSGRTGDLQPTAPVHRVWHDDIIILKRK